MDLKHTCKIAREKWVAMRQHERERFLLEQDQLKRGETIITATRHGEVTMLPVLPGTFLAAWFRFLDDDPTALAEYLRSDRPLSARDREELALLIEEKVIRGQFKKPRRGQRNTKVHVAARFALEFYDVWRAENKERGVDDYGRSNYMKDEAAKIAIEYLKAKKFPAINISTVSRSDR